MKCYLVSFQRLCMFSNILLRNLFGRRYWLIPLLWLFTDLLFELGPYAHLFTILVWRPLAHTTF